MRTEPVTGESARRRWQALGICLVAAFMTLLDISIVNVALPSIRSGLHASPDGLQWILSGYALTFGLVLVAAGRLGDARSRRAVFMAGLALFTLASAAAGLARTIAWLVVARLVQGMAGGILNPQIAGLIQILFRGPERGRAFGSLGATIGIATAAGPVIGGALIALAGPDEGWRWVFYVNIPIGLTALPLAYRLLPAPNASRPVDEAAPAHGSPPPRRAHRRESLDPVGVVLLGTGVVMLLLPFVQEQQWHGQGKWLLVPSAAIILTVFVRWERRHDEPMIDLSLFRLRSYALGAAIALLYFAGFTAIFFIFTLYLQNGLGYSALAAGLAITPFALGSGVAAAVGGRIVARLGRPLVAAGLATVTAGLAGTLLAVRLEPGPRVALATAVPLLLAGLGSGLVIAPNQTITLSEVPPEGGGSAAGILQTGQRIGTSAGIAAVGAIFFATVAGTRGDWALAFRRGLVIVIGFVLAALGTAVADLVADLVADRGRGSPRGPRPTAGDRRLAPGGPGRAAHMAEITLRVNGTERSLDVDTRISLLDLLRERLGLTGSKKGCDHGQCGACTVLIDGRRANACLALAVACADSEVTTVEGLADGAELHPLQAAFIERDAFQCGYCTPGQLCSAVGMLAEGGPSAVTDDLAVDPPLTAEEIRERMSGNLCRCGAYVNIVAAIEGVARARKKGDR